MTDETVFSHILRTAALSQRKPTRFAIVPDAAACARLAGALDLLALGELSFRGEIRPAGRHDFHLVAELAAEVTQACIVTLAPVPSRIFEVVQRRFSADYADPATEEAEVPEDDSIEPLGEVIDLGAVMTEALALALPLYPRAPGAEFAGALAAEPGAAPLTDEAMRPFAGLAGLMGRKTDGTGE